MIGTDYIDSWQSNYHTITVTTTQCRCYKLSKKGYGCKWTCTLLCVSSTVAALFRSVTITCFLVSYYIDNILLTFLQYDIYRYRQIVHHLIVNNNLSICSLNTQRSLTYYIWWTLDFYTDFMFISHFDILHLL